MIRSLCAPGLTIQTAARFESSVPLFRSPGRFHPATALFHRARRPESRVQRSPSSWRRDRSDRPGQFADRVTRVCSDRPAGFTDRSANVAVAANYTAEPNSADQLIVSSRSGDSSLAANGPDATLRRSGRIAQFVGIELASSLARDGEPNRPNYHEFDFSLGPPDRVVPASAAHRSASSLCSAASRPSRERRSHPTPRQDCSTAQLRLCRGRTTDRPDDRRPENGWPSR